MAIASGYVYSVCFFVKQKTAYELLISDWSSDVCSSDLPSFLQSLMEQFFKVDEPWTVDSLDVLLVGVGEGYTFDDSHHQVEDLGINVVFGPVPVPGVTLTNGVFAAGEIETSVEAEAGDIVHAVEYGRAS